MNFGRKLAKLRWDGPRHLLSRIIDRFYRRQRRRQQRARWATAAPQARVPLAAGFDSRWAQQLWPGAADPRWCPGAAQRWPTWHAAAQQQAEAAAHGVFDLLCSGPVDVRDGAGGLRWHDDFKGGATFPADRLYLDVPICLPQDGTDIKIPWELSRFQQVFAWLWTDPQRYGEVFLTQWRHWLQHNPVARGVNWVCAMDVALRAVSWTAALAAWGHTWDRATLDEMGAALALHGEFVRDNLEWIIGDRTNHYFSDITGLAVISAALGDYPPAREWAALAARELRREILRQFAPDGLDRECSSTYHRLMVELATLGWRACQVAGHDLGSEVRQRLVRAYEALDVLCDASGHGPLIGDNDSGRVFPLVQRADTELRYLLPLGAALLDAPHLAVVPPCPEVALLAGPAALEATTGTTDAAPAVAGRALPDSGIFALGRGGDRLIVRCGPLTSPPTGTHRHLDQLSITLAVGGQALLVDPGQYCYTTWPGWRVRFISTFAHNTIFVDDEEQCRLFDLGRSSYTIIPETRPRLLQWEATSDHARFVGEHRGYARLRGGGPVRREVCYTPTRRAWQMTDDLALRGPHRVQWRFHLHPDATLTGAGVTWQVQRGGSTLHIQGELAGVQGRAADAWYAPAYGCKVATQVLLFEAATAGRVRSVFRMRAEGPA